MWHDWFFRQSPLTSQKKITSVKAYADEVNPTRHALQCALETRQFEIELYWRRATYFWTLSAASLAAFFLLMSADEPQQELIFVVSCIGGTLSLAWYLANRGSKYWQENWERHIDVLEELIIGGSALFKTTISRDRYGKMQLTHGYPYSLSRINQVISLYIVFIWAVLAAWRFCALLTSGSSRVFLVLVTLVTAVFCICLLYSTSSVQREDRVVDFTKTPLTESPRVYNPNGHSEIDR